MSDRLKPGDVLFYQRGGFSDEWSPDKATVANVGRKWATIVNGWHDTCVNIETLELDGRRSWGRMWRSEQEWTEAKEADRQRRDDYDTWDRFQRAVRFGRIGTLPPHADTTRQAATLLGIDLGEMP